MKPWLSPVSDALGEQNRRGAMVTMTLMLAASPSVASSRVATPGTTFTPPMPRTVSATSPCTSGPVTIPATHVHRVGLSRSMWERTGVFIPFG